MRTNQDGANWEGMPESPTTPSPTPSPTPSVTQTDPSSSESPDQVLLRKAEEAKKKAEDPPPWGTLAGKMVDSLIAKIGTAVKDFSDKRSFDFSTGLNKVKTTPLRRGTKSLSQVTKEYKKTIDKQLANYKTPDYVTTSSKNAMKPAKYKPRTNTSSFYARGK